MNSIRLYVDEEALVEKRGSDGAGDQGFRLTLVSLKDLFWCTTFRFLRATSRGTTDV